MNLSRSHLELNKKPLKHREIFVLNYLTPSLESTYIEMTIPTTPAHQEQRYRLNAIDHNLKKKLAK